MGTQRVADTNVFYDLAAGLIDPAKLLTGTSKIAISPMSILELASKVDETNFPQRQGAARAALQIDVEILPDPERHLASIWEVPVSYVDVPWGDALIALSSATNAAQLEKGVEDWQNRVRRIVRVPFARSLRDFHSTDFVAKMVSAIDSYVPGYAKKRAKGLMKQSGASDAARLKKMLLSPAALLAVLLATRDRAFLAGDITTATDVTKDEMVRALDQILPYVMVYSRYFEKAATVFAPQENDLGDLECFIYLQDGRDIATAEIRWIEIANEVGLGNAVHDTKLDRP